MSNNRQSQSFNNQFGNNGRQSRSMNQGNQGGNRNRSRSPRGRAPSNDMLNRPVTVQDLPGLRLVDLQSLAQNMGLNVSRNADKMTLVETISFGLNNSGPVYLDQNVANLTSSGGQRSPRGGSNFQYNEQHFAQFIQPLIAQTEQLQQSQQGGQGGRRGSGNFGGYRSRWQFLTSQVTQWARQQGGSVNAAQAAKMLDPYYKGQRERQANEPGNQSGSRNNQGGNNGNRGNQSGAMGNINQAQLQQFINNFNQQNGNQGGFRSQWQALISAVARQYKVNAAQAAVLLDPFYHAQRERFPNEPGNQSGGRNNRNNQGNNNQGGNRGSGNFGNMMSSFNNMNLGNNQNNFNARQQGGNANLGGNNGSTFGGQGMTRLANQGGNRGGTMGGNANFNSGNNGSTFGGNFQ